MSVFKPIDASEEGLEDNGITEIESICMDCYLKGTTRLMLTRIPFYRDVVISSFNCEHCHVKNNLIESANKIQDQGTIIRLLVDTKTDLNRELVKSDFATLTIPLIDFEIPCKTQKGVLTTVEGVVSRVISNLETDIKMKKEYDVDLAEKLTAFVAKLKDLKDLKLGQFELVVDDPSGDSFIENPNAPKKDPKLIQTYYRRNKEQNELLGIEEDKDLEDDMLTGEDQIASFQNNCPNCNGICETNMKITEIPYFKKIVLMCSSCESCGIKSAEVKSGAGIEEKGVKYTLKLTDQSDLNRDLLKSDSATFEIPEIELYMNAGTLGDKFTTIEGLLKDMKENLYGVAPFSMGDSESKDKNQRLTELLSRVEEIYTGKNLDVTVILDDPSGNSYLQNVYAPEEDPNMKKEFYERSFEQNELLGINDMNTENYMTDEQKKQIAEIERLEAQN